MIHHCCRISGLDNQRPQADSATPSAEPASQQGEGLPADIAKISRSSSLFGPSPQRPEVICLLAPSVPLLAFPRRVQPIYSLTLGISGLPWIAVESRMLRTPPSVAVGG